MINLMGKRYWYFALSLLIIIPGMICVALWGLPLSIEFKGGSLLEAQFASGKSPEPATVIEVYHSLGIADVQITTSGADILIIRSSVTDQTTLSNVEAAISAKVNDKIIVLSFDTMSPSLAQEVANRGILVVLVSSLVLTIYIAVVFRKVAHPIRYGVCTVVALLHDVLVMLSIAAIGGKFWGWQVDTMFLTAMLTVIAFSAQDTIVVFDRIRENAGIYRRLPFEKLVNHSVVQTLTRSINTQIMAVDFLLLAVALFGGVTLKEFATLLLIGMFSGSYSSGFTASPLLIVWENQEWKNWFHRKSQPIEA